MLRKVDWGKWAKSRGSPGEELCDVIDNVEDHSGASAVRPGDSCKAGIWWKIGQSIKKKNGFGGWVQQGKGLKSNPDEQVISLSK